MGSTSRPVTTTTTSSSSPAGSSAAALGSGAGAGADRSRFDRAGGWAVALLPAASVLAYAFDAGGYFPGAVASGMFVLAALALVATVVGRPTPRPAGPARVALGALGGLAAWTLASALWSGNAWRAIVEFDRLLLYALAFAVCGAWGASPEAARRACRALAAVIVAVALSSLAVRLAPGLFAVGAETDEFGLAYPVTYANTLGLLAVLGVLLCVFLASARDEASALRVVAAAAVPPLLATLALTGSIGAAAAGLAGLVVLVLAARPRALAGTLVATTPTSALAVASALSLETATGPGAQGSVGASQGASVAVVLVLCVANAAFLRGLALRLGDRAWAALRGAPRVAVAAAVAALLSAAAAGGAAGLGALSGPGGPGSARVDHWLVGLESFASAPLNGHGAGTYALLSQAARTTDAAVRDAHSLPVEVLAELGLVGALLLATAVGAVGVGLVRSLRGADSSVAGLVAALGATWLLHASIDWDWEMPVITLPVLALCGMAVGASSARACGGAPPRRRAARVSLAVACGVLLAWSALVVLSERRLREAGALARIDNCAGAAALAEDAILDVRPEIHTVSATCLLRAARNASGAERRRAAERSARAADAAARRDPGDVRHVMAAARARALAVRAEAR